jgi:RNA polymerase sigma-70 factor, ECF subfamily
VNHRIGNQFTNSFGFPVAVVETREANKGDLASYGTRERTRERIAIIWAMSGQDLSDEALISKYRAEADATASQRYADELFRRYQAKVARWCLAFTGDIESAADLAQEIFAKAYQNLLSFRAQAKFSTWLFSIAKNHCLNALRSRFAAPKLDSEELLADLPDPACPSPDAAIEHEQLVKAARQLINSELEETERLVFTLHFAEELPLDAITRMLNLTNPSGAKAYLVSAKRKLDRAAKRLVKTKA